MRRRPWYALAAAALLAGAAIPLATAARARAATRPPDEPLELVPLAARREVPLAVAPAPDPAVMRVCADPNNMPFSNARGDGFENRIAALLARDLGQRVEYLWWPQRRGFLRYTLNTGRCDVVIGVPSAYDRLLRTAPYYRSTYVFVTRRDRGLRLASLDDPALRRLRIGLHVMGDDYANSPAEQALDRRGLQRNVVGYSIYGNYDRADPPADLLRAVARGDVDVAIAWGPLAGYFAARDSVPLALTPVTPEIDLPFNQFVYDIALGVRRADTLRRDRLDGALARRAPEIAAILASYHIPVPDSTGRFTP